MYKKLLLVLSSTSIFMPAISQAESNKTPAQKNIEVFHGWCVQNLSDYSSIDRMAELEKAKKMPKKFIEADPVLYQKGGSAYLINHENEKFIVSYVKGGGCSILSGDIDHKNLSKKLRSNYKLGSEHIDEFGVQVNKYYKFLSTSHIAGSVVSITYAKPETGYKEGSISIVSKEALEEDMKNN